MYRMKRIKVSCITKTDKHDPDERISHIGGELNGSYWKVPVSEAIHNMEMGFFTYYVSEQGKEVDITIALHNGNKYLKTQSDTTNANNLLSLQQCTSKHR